MCPSPTLQVQPYDCPHMVGARMVRYSFLLYDSFIHYSTPVYPDAIQVGNLRPIGNRPFARYSASPH
jgi:hypothetical protein